ncbi:MAG: DUF4340 domain-containing protein [Terrimicrobiaceae bacterium]
MKPWLLVIPVLVAAAFFLRPSSPTATSGKLFPDFRPDDVRSIQISATKNHVTLIRRSEGWTVLERDNFPADPARITQLLRQMWDLAPTQEIPARPPQLDRFQLLDEQTGAPPNHQAMEVSFLDQNKKSFAVLLLGKLQTQEGKEGMPGMVSGRFVRPSGHEGSVYLTKELFHEVLPSPMAWLDKRFPAIAQPRAFEYRSHGDHWKVVLEDGQWKLDDTKNNEAMDPNTLYSLLTQWAAPSFFDVAPSPDNHDFTPEAQLTIHDAKGESVTYDIGVPGRAAYPVKVRGASHLTSNHWKDRIFLVEAPLVDAIPKTRAEMTMPPHPPQETKPPASL